MDTSEEYVRMSDCVEIQWQRERTDCFVCLEMGDWFLNHQGRIFVHSFHPGRRKRPLVWLPRQDQIQEMVRDYYAEGIKPTRPRAWFPEGVVGLTYVLKKFNEFAPSNGLIAHETKSFEQLWLKFYMYEKYQKVWDGEKWLN